MVPDIGALASPQAIDGLRGLMSSIDALVEDDPLFQEISRQVTASGGNLSGLRLGGGATWAPCRDPKDDWSAWGSWEAWEECTIGLLNGGQAIGAIPTGGWLVWNASTGQTLGLPASNSARKQAEMWALLNNSGKQTRVVPHRGEAVASTIDFTTLVRQVGGEVQRLVDETDHSPG